MLKFYQLSLLGTILSHKRTEESETALQQQQQQKQLPLVAPVVECSPSVLEVMRSDPRPGDIKHLKRNWYTSLTCQAVGIKRIGYGAVCIMQ